MSGVAVLTLCAAMPLAGSAGTKRNLATAETSSNDLAPDAGRDALRQIVQNQCVLNWTQKQDPAPCERVFLADAKTNSSGYAILADRKGGAHYLLIPTQTMAGVDASELLDPDAPNYFAEAWHARGLITKFVGHPVPRTAIGLAVNTAHSRTQDQYHIHIECLRQDVYDSLHAVTQQITETWSSVTVAGSTYSAMKIQGDGLDGSNPNELLAKLNPDVRHHMGDYTLVVAGAQFSSGPGFVLLTGKAGPTGELLLDSSCAVAGGGG